MSPIMKQKDEKPEKRRRDDEGGFGDNAESTSDTAEESQAA
jgi:hypothetical protein